MVSLLHAKAWRAARQRDVLDEEPLPLTLRIVIDTNSLVAALTRPRGSSARILNLWRQKRIELVTSKETRREAELVLGGRWLAKLTSPAAVATLLAELERETLHVEPVPVPDLRLKDRGDRDLVAAAVGGRADYLVTADREVLEKRGYEGVEFVTSAEFLVRTGEALGDESSADRRS